MAAVANEPAPRLHHVTQSHTSINPTSSVLAVFSSTPAPLLKRKALQVRLRSGQHTRLSRFASRNDGLLANHGLLDFLQVVFDQVH